MGLSLLVVIENLLRAATVAALTALSLTPAGPALADEGPLVPQASPCAAVVAPAGRICVPSPKQCIKAPCPQYDLLQILPYHPLPSYEEVMAAQGPNPAP
ncbi:hypothetical protein [Streptomyces sp. ML-6]|uniref:hypothetical protein n=1 Tax=unclassified Streptomyces TaxID=2593676 RepID=UPI0024BF7966|nr:hypothetical protein [Streptomyces sp. ML-6]MDK0517787.1 hypothetical protein [Streptomyces sp. ML-6]